MARKNRGRGSEEPLSFFLFPVGRVFDRKEAKMPKKVKTFFGSETMGRLISTKQQLESIITL